jgi:hypothetical protein
MNEGSGKPDDVKMSSPVWRGLRHEVAYVFVMLEYSSKTQCSAIGTLSGCAVGVIQRYKAPETMKPHSREWQLNREGRL